MHLQQIQRPGIGEETQNRECLRFMQEKSIVKASEFINGQRDHEIELRPQPYADNGHWVWPIAAGQHQKKHAHNDATVRGEKTDEPPMRQTIRLKFRLLVHTRVDRLLRRRWRTTVLRLLFRSRSENAIHL